MGTNQGISLSQKKRQRCARQYERSIHAWHEPSFHFHVPYRAHHHHCAITYEAIDSTQYRPLAEIHVRLPTFVRDDHTLPAFFLLLIFQ